MDNPYQDLSKQALVFEIESAARIPADGLVIEACSRFAELESDLCQLLDAPVGLIGIGGHVLAGLLLIEGQSLVSVPHFASIYRHPEKEPLLSPWFDSQLPRIGPPLIHPFQNLLADPRASFAARKSAIDILSLVGIAHPEYLDKIVDSFRRAAREITNGAFVGNDESELLVWAVSGLVELGDRDSAPFVKTQSDRSDLEPNVVNALRRYAEHLGSGIPPIESPNLPLILDFYREVRVWDEMSKHDVAGHYEQAMLRQGVRKDVVSRVLSVFRSPSGDGVRDDRGAKLVDLVKSTLSSAGVSEPELDLAVKTLFAAIFSYEGVEAETKLALGPDRFVRIKLDIH